MTTQWTEHDGLPPYAARETDDARRAQQEEQHRHARKKTKGLLMGGLLLVLVAGGAYALIASQGAEDGSDPATIAAPDLPAFTPATSPDITPPIPPPQTEDALRPSSAPALAEPAGALPPTP